MESGDPLSVANCDLFIGGWLLTAIRYEESIDVCRSALASAPEFAYRHVIESQLAWSLLAAGRTAEAMEVVDDFTPVPPGSQWGYTNSIVAHLVLAHTDGPEVAGRSLALVAREAVARRPQIGSEFLIGFAYFDYLSGDTVRARFISEHTLAVGMGGVRMAMLFAESGASGDAAIELIEAHHEEIPASELHRPSAGHGPRLLTEELERWS